jgi:hypothetical protein
MIVRVYHAYYGCDTGCCGHIVSIEEEVKEQFIFTHPYEEKDIRAWAKKLALEVIENCWPECLKEIDWDTIEIEGVSEE